jgi:hypothetical protein
VNSKGGQIIGRYRIKPKKLSCRQAVKKSAQLVADEVERGLHSRDEDYIITPEQRGLLDKISLLVLPLAEIEDKIVSRSATARGHYGFAKMVVSTDTATIQTALRFCHIDRWHCPLKGGMDFLEHVLVCQRCQLMIKQVPAEASPNDLVSQIFEQHFEGDFDQELRSRGISLRDIEGETLKEVLQTKKPN